MILAIDTATQHASLALYRDEGIFAEESWFAGRNHTIELAPRINRMLQLAQLRVPDLTALAVALGPGSFTGLRIGLAAAKGMALPYKLPVIGVPTLDIVAYPFREHDVPVWAIAEAGRSRILAARYDCIDNEWQVVDEPHITTFEGLAEKIDQPVLCTGEIPAEARQLLRKASGGKTTVATV
ncbi:MAG: tRNA (adenosine(37)-N6)-threonylcarbamoyltransferase complex dimerization subunit type 1 TsaB, partial [Anaerolineae bacterium]|nr:tRNA (adenosine(37)-N6)-threonylcarbamoyltransferase complex dimerization subunit type 1 TsaB [Anaerolineae bacterium]